MVTGVHQPDGGQILVNGQLTHFFDALDARQAGIAAIYQELSLFPDLDVAENIFVGRQPIARGGRIDWRKLYREADKLISSLGVQLDLKKKARNLSIAQQQMVEIARAFSINARLLIMDEPTSSLTLNEVADLFRLVRRLREEGTAIIFISHRIEELFELADRVTVLRDGAYIDTRPISEVSRDDLIRMMVGRTITNLFPKLGTQPGETVLKVENLSRRGVFENVNFELHSGEIMGMAGLVGAGRTDVALAIFGVATSHQWCDTHRRPGPNNYLARKSDPSGDSLCARRPADPRNYRPNEIVSNISLPLLKTMPSAVGSGQGRMSGCFCGLLSRWRCAPAAFSNGPANSRAAISKKCSWPGGWRQNPTS